MGIFNIKAIQRLKIELFYLRKMFSTYGFRLSYWFRYFKNRYFGNYLLKRLPKWECNRADNFEIHVLTQKQALWMLAWNLRSFLYYSGLCPKIVIHSDGSIDPKTAKMFECKFPNLEVILRENADEAINKRTDIPDKIKKYRMGKNILILEFTDIYLLSRSNKVMLLDNDLLFFKKPQEIIDFFHDKINLDAVATYANGESPLFIDQEYMRKYQLKEKGAHGLISGIIMYKKEKFPLDRFIEYFDHTLDPENHFIEQAGWAVLLCQTNFKYLDIERYPVKGMPATETVVKHYTSPRRHELYAYGIDLVRRNLK